MSSSAPEAATPAVTVDLDVLEANLVRMSTAVSARGVRLRPHAKAHRTPAIADMQLAHGAVGITVAKVSEAEVMAAAGIRDIFVANVLAAPEAIGRYLRLARSCRMRTCVDSVAVADRLAAAARAAGTTLDVLVDVDVGLGRTGVQPEAGVWLAREVSQRRSLRLAGVFAYGGHAPLSAAPERHREQARREAEIAVAVAGAVREAGLPADEVSVAGTPATRHAVEVPGVTEVRAGSYVFNHGRYVRHGFCERVDCALAIRTTVVSRPARDRAIVDAGRNLLGDGSTEEDDLGLLPDLPGSRLAEVWEEHGLIELDGSHRVDVGDVITVVPHFLRPVVNQACCWHAVRRERVERTVQIAARGCSV